MMEYLLAFHPGQTLLVIGALGFVAGMFFTVWLDDQYRKEEEEEKQRRKDGIDEISFNRQDFR